MATNLPATTKVANIRTLLVASKRQMEMALPKHLTADRLIRVAMTSIQKTPKLMDCTQQSLLACIMTCASLGLEPDQFLGQAYLVPYGNECTLIPGYRGYISLARRSGDLQSLSAQAVYAKDHFSLQFGIEEKLEHVPYDPTDADMETKEPRGAFRGAYCVFKYKDGSYSFDYMNKAEIDAIRKRSKASGSGPWVTDYAEMAKKTVIKRHVKLAPLSVEFQRAVALEERAMAGESQKDLLGIEQEGQGIIDAESESQEDLLAKFDGSAPKGAAPEAVASFLKETAEKNLATVEAVKLEAVKSEKSLSDFWKFFTSYQKQKKADTPVPESESRFDCPNGGFVTVTVCDGCKDREPKEGDLCPAYSAHVDGQNKGE